MVDGWCLADHGEILLTMADGWCLTDHGEILLTMVDGLGTVVSCYSPMVYATRTTPTAE